MKQILFLLLTTLAFTANSAVLTFNETTNPALDNVFLDAGQSSVDTTTTLEWLNFRDISGTSTIDYTLGQSVNSASAWYVPQGWAVATQSQVSNLFDTMFGDFGFTPGANGTQVIQEVETAPLIQSRNSWLLGFGSDATIAPDGTVIIQNNALWSAGFYLKPDLTTIGMAGININGSTIETTLYGTDYNWPGLSANSAGTNFGVFMVREYVPAVPVPAAAWLFGSGLLGLVAVARRKS